MHVFRPSQDYSLFTKKRRRGDHLRLAQQLAHPEEILLLAVKMDGHFPALHFTI